MADIYDCNPVKYADDIEELTVAAEKEMKIEAQFNKVKDKFKEAKFFFSEFKNRGELIMESTNTSELVADLEEQ